MFLVDSIYSIYTFFDLFFMIQLRMVFIMQRCHDEKMCIVRNCVLPSKTHYNNISALFTDFATPNLLTTKVTDNYLNTSINMYLI